VVLQLLLMKSTIVAGGGEIAPLPIFWGDRKLSKNLPSINLGPKMQNFGLKLPFYVNSGAKLKF